MSKISEMYEQIKEQQYLLVRTKLNEAVKARKENRELSEEEKEDYKFSDREIEILINLLKEQGLERDRDFTRLYIRSYEPVYTSVILKTDNDVISILADNHGLSTMPIVGIKELKENVEHVFGNDTCFEKAFDDIGRINEINLEELQRQTNPEKEATIAEAKEELYHFESHEVIDTRKVEVEIDDIYVSNLSWVIELILRNEIVDSRANAYFGDCNNTCKIGRYDDMPGEEEIANILNSVDRSLLAKYFTAYPYDIYLFEEMRSKHSDVLPLDLKDISNDKNEYIENLLKHATTKSDLSKKNEQAKDLLNGYEKQEKKDGEEPGDEE